MEKILLYHPDETAFETVRRTAASQKLRCVRLDVSALSLPLGVLEKGAPLPAAAPFTGAAPSESLLLMCDLSDQRMDRLLLALKKSGVSIDFKAILTPVNRSWSVLRLLVALHAERAAYERMQER